MSYVPIRSVTALNSKNIVFETVPLKTKRNGKSNKSPSIRQNGRSSSNGSTSPSNLWRSDYSIIVHCHLCWDWVWQRPQQFLSRFSARHKVLFVETIGPDADLASPLARVRQVQEYPNITILRLQFPAWRWEDSAYVDEQRRKLVQEFLLSPHGKDFQNPVQWFYDPMAVTAFAGQMAEVLTVYDCMDELSKFKCAPPAIREREAQLLAKADVVFTGGRRLWESKRRSNPNCHFFGCGVDNAHFGQARDGKTVIPAGLASLHKPVLGYFGVVDERMDYGLLASLADANPSWSIAMVGPVCKVDPAELPQRKNLHWLGKQDYRDLPAFCKGFDVCLMPFALNESTEYINPTKALEYMATGRPIVSTAVPDVVRNFGSVVQVAANPEEFVRLCKDALEHPDPGLISRGLEMAQENSWECIVVQMEDLIEEAAARKAQRIEVLA